MRPLRSRKQTPAEQRQDLQRQARNNAPTLRVLLPSARQVRVELAFDEDEHLANSPSAYTAFPPARAHFVYACAFGDCDGAFNLNEEIFGMLLAGSRQTSGRLHCTGHRERRNGKGPRCGLLATYTVCVSYGAERPTATVRPMLAQ